MIDLVFLGALPNVTPRKGVKFNPESIASFRQHDRVFSPEGLGPALSGQEASGRYWILIEL